MRDRDPTTQGVCDLLVVGAGPAGCAAAITAARAGLSTVLVEAAPFPRCRPGESLHPGVEPLLEQLDVGHAVRAAGFLRYSGHWVRWGDEPERLELFGQDNRGRWLGFQAWRATFDALLLEQARAAGVTICQPCRAVKPMVKACRVTGVETRTKPWRSRMVIDAAGNGHWLARQLGVRIQRVSRRLVARYGYVAGECPARDRFPALAATAREWTWTARVRPGIYAWVHLPLRGAKVPAGWRPEEFERQVSWGRPRAADVTWRSVTRLAGPGWLLAGDAAFVLDPSSSHGVLKGLMSGMQAAQLAGAILDGSVPEPEGLRFYQRWLDAWFLHDAQALGSVYARLSAGRDAPDGD